VPKITVICNGSFGAGNYGMSGRAFDPRFLFMWPQSQISVMGAEQAANVLADIKVRQLSRAGETLSPDQIDAIRDPILEEYRRHQSAYYSTSKCGTMASSIPSIPAMRSAWPSASRWNARSPSALRRVPDVTQ